ncbi:fimbria/pilus periplasmic chaperone [Stenotrophomonas sp. 364]|uniref:fimbrial biogenesis chaperone n=1 Tax=Stenotrophomonas sp. 364 TaxID=2691571 RepID=UPI0013184A46|nr:fimbria/pilus periplasmic chaperone [Stenotrophomonas sp. 364]QHB70802.1 fimbria/pilus periplasmic chaperone [Stenotrophomonas sp. 364]
MRRPAALALGVLAAWSVHALEIRPVRVSVPAGPAHAELWLTNPDGAPWSGQARLYRWEQASDQEQLVPATDLAVSPARLEIAPGQRQRVRVVRLGAVPAAVQQGYRLVISPDTGVGDARYSLPVFVEPDRPVPPVPRLQVGTEGSPSAPRLHLYNDGDGHAGLADLVFVDAQGRRQPLIDGLAGYVLPRSARRWELPPRPDGYAGGRFRARLNDAAEALLPAVIAPAPGTEL